MFHVDIEKKNNSKYSTETTITIKIIKLRMYTQHDEILFNFC